ncbi:MAG: methylase [Leptospiraceae bacterium]|nr:MAG: methylase [Leptospiraceae bacterium]
MKNTKKDTSWDEQAKWYDKIVGEDGSYYHKELIVPTLLQELGDVKNKKILDLGSGQGFFCRILSQRGANVIGVDLSKNLIQLARKYPSKNIQYYVGNAENLSFLNSNEFDYIVSILSLGNMKNIDKVFNEVYRLLKPNGKFYFIIIHPCFRIPRQSHWEFDENKKNQYRRIDMYMSELDIPIITHPGKIKEKNKLTDQDYTIMFHRPLSKIFEYLKKNNLLVSNLLELCSNKISIGKRAKAENRARKEFPLFLLIEAIKLI